MASRSPPDDYADYLMRLYGGEQEGQGSELSRPTTACASIDTTPQRRPPARTLSAAERLSRNRAAKRATTDVTLFNHLSSMHHMNRRIYELYSKAGLLGQGGARGARQRPAAAAYGVPPPSVAGVSRALSPTSLVRSGPASRPATAPGGGSAFAQQQQQQQQAHGVAVPVHRTAAAAAGRPETAPPPPPSFVKRHVQNTAAALKTAILDEICEHRIYEGARLRALLRSYLSLNADQPFYPTLVRVCEELRCELGVA